MGTLILRVLLQCSKSGGCICRGVAVLGCTHSTVMGARIWYVQVMVEVLQFYMVKLKNKINLMWPMNLTTFRQWSLWFNKILAAIAIIWMQNFRARSIYRTTLGGSWLGVSSCSYRFGFYLILLKVKSHKKTQKKLVKKKKMHNE